MTGVERLMGLLEERGTGYYRHEAPAADCVAFFDGERWHDCWESECGEVNVTFSMTPEQAMAAMPRPRYEPPVAAHLDGDVLTLTTTRDPSIIRVQRAEGQPLKVYRNVHELEVRWARLLTLLRDEWDIDVAWDGLRRFWCVCLTAEGVRKRDEREAKVASSRGPAKAKPVIVSDEETDCATGHCACGACGEPIDPWDRFCRWCGAEVDR